MEVMLKPKALVEVLSQANTGGVISTMLLNQKGSLLAYAGSEDKDVKVTAAVASNIWAAYEKSGKLAFHNEGLRFMFLNCEEGTVTVTKVANTLLCMYSKPDVGLGLIKTKAEAMAEYLEQPLLQVTS
eukprot:Seg1947.7 transcript_id=Seg1947.7/GoldUCD/mRNA.D3Y31 product="Ragulator complex protein LAMTOR2" protein_id=Seg1947.7/GoldUCD/D3Y31